MGLGSGIRKTRIQESKRHRIPDPDPQHWFFIISAPIHEILVLVQCQRELMEAVSILFAIQ